MQSMLWVAVGFGGKDSEYVIANLQCQTSQHLETPESLDMVYTWYILCIYF